MEIRKAAIKWGGNDADLVGPEIKVGQKAPDFAVIDGDQKPVTLKDTTGKVRVFASLVSVDTSVCDREMRRFNEDAAKLPGVEIDFFSVDLPGTQKRWCGAAGVDKVRMLSDHRKVSFGEAYGVLEPNRRQFARAVWVLDKDDVVRHVEYMKTPGEEPNYAALLEVVRSLTGSAS